jgi:two-component sensor histidine kinase
MVQLAHHQRLAVTERRHGEDRQALMVRELHHRVKNTLATVQAVVNATAWRSSPWRRSVTSR